MSLGNFGASSLSTSPRQPLGPRTIPKLNGNGVSPARDPSDFAIVSVKISVLDSSGAGLGDANLLAFDENYGIRMPNNGFNVTAPDGSFTYRLPAGTWSFFATSPPSSVGQGYFIVARSITIAADVGLSLRPDSTISLTSYDGSGSPLNGQVRIMDQTHTPIIQTYSMGTTDNGKFTIAVASGSYMILFWGQAGNSGYAMLKNAMSGSSIEVRPDSSSAHIQVKTFDSSMNPSGGTFSVNYDDFDLVNPVGFQVNGQLDLYATPSLVTTTFSMTPPPWSFQYFPEDYMLASGQQLSLSYGGQLSVRIYTQTGAAGEASQIWLYVVDSFGKEIGAIGDGPTPVHALLTLTRDGSTILQKDIGNNFWNGVETHYDVNDSPSYTLQLDMGPEGTRTLQGILLSADNLLPFKDITFQHVTVHVPDLSGQVTERFTKIANYFNEAFEAEKTILHESFTNPMDSVAFQIDVIAGVAGANRVNLAIGFSLASSYVTIPSTLIGVGGHELGHTFQLSPPYDYYIANWFGEPDATLHENLAIGQIFGERLALYDRGAHDYFYSYLLGHVAIRNVFDLIENVQFILFYVEKNYGLSSLLKLYIDTSNRNLLLQNGYNLNETVITLLSYETGTDLNWLFTLAGFNVPDGRIQAGLNLISSRPPSLDLSAPQVNGLAVTVNGTASPGTPGTTINRINWAWGDGTSGDAWFPATHTYSQAGTYTINATSFQSDGLSTTKTTSVTLQKSFDFSLSNSGGIMVVPGGSGSTTVTVTLLSGSSELASLSCPNLSEPVLSGWSCSFGPDSGYPTFSSILTVSVPPAASIGAYPLTVTGSGGGLVRTATVQVTVTTGQLSVGLVSPPSPANGATVSSSPVTLQVQVTSQGPPVQSATVTIYVDGSQACSGGSDSSGTYSCSYSPSQGGHSWYATASKSGYASGTSQTWAFTYQPPGRCIIATVAYGSEMAPDVVYMRYVRDQVIGSTHAGRALVNAFNTFYYAWSPTVAQGITGNELLRALFRVLLLPIVGIAHVAALMSASVAGAAGSKDVASVVAFVLAASLSVVIYVALPVLAITKLVQAIRKRSQLPYPLP